MEGNSTMKQTHLYNEHCEAGAKMVPYAGYEMPLQYSTIKEEVTAVRSACGIFDVSHMQVMRIRGSNRETLEQYLNYLTCRDVSKLSRGKVQYNALMSSGGGILDDITIYRIDDNDVYLISNAGRAKEVSEQFSKVKVELNLDINLTSFTDHCLIAVQGPTSENNLSKLYPQWSSEIQDLEYYSFHLTNESENTFIARTGYTGEDGFEIFLPAEKGRKLWSDLNSQHGVTPCGLASRDNLRMEVFYPLYGNELNDDRSPRESGMSRLIDMDKDFFGKEALLAREEKDTKIIRGIIMENKNDIPRTGFSIFNDQDQKIGEVTSGGFSFTWNCGFGLGFIEKEFAKKDSTVFVEIRGTKKPGIIKIRSPYKGSIKLKKAS